ncbi:30S ribosomal protein S15 [Candidatus Micrarchaeota archaeon]|nr:30S ribosomal protein S15 [Candidatus Micrarchaeota archaeon]
MAKLHSKKRGKSGSRRLIGKELPSDVIKPDEIEKLINTLAKEGNNATTIGLILKKEHNVPSVRAVCNKTVSKILEENNIKVEYPDDILTLIKKAVGMRKHLNSNTRDTHNKTKLIHVESKIRRLARYYTKNGRLPADWKYDPETAVLIVK